MTEMGDWVCKTKLYKKKSELSADLPVPCPTIGQIKRGMLLSVDRKMQIGTVLAGHKPGVHCWRHCRVEMQ